MTRLRRRRNGLCARKAMTKSQWWMRSSDRPSTSGHMSWNSFPWLYALPSRSSLHLTQNIQMQTTRIWNWPTSVALLSGIAWISFFNAWFWNLMLSKQHHRLFCLLSYLLFSYSQKLCLLTDCCIRVSSCLHSFHLSRCCLSLLCPLVFCFRNPCLQRLAWSRPRINYQCRQFLESP